MTILEKKEINPKNITSLHFSKRDGKIDLVFYVDRYIPYPNPIPDYKKISCNDFELEVEE